VAHCAWQLRRAFDTLRHGSADWPPQSTCEPDTSGRSAEGSLDILKILREASGDSN
jgi:hypothetical protein